MAEKAQQVEDQPIPRERRKLNLKPVKGWPDEFLEILGSIDEEIERLPQTPITELEDPFA